MRVLTWNLQWVTSKTPRAEELRRRILNANADVAVLTEVTERFLATLGGDYALSDLENHYARKKNTQIKDRHKVALWSPKFAFQDIDRWGDSTLPSGRFVAGTLDNATMQFRVCGICIPWNYAQVNTGEKNRQPWEEHITYLSGLKAYLSGTDQPFVLAGDFNQKIPRHRQSIAVANLLSETISSLNVCTQGVMMPEQSQSIDHVAISHHFTLSKTQTISAKTADKPLSDHFGVLCEIQPSGTTASC